MITKKYEKGKNAKPLSYLIKYSNELKHEAMRVRKMGMGKDFEKRKTNLFLLLEEYNYYSFIEECLNSFNKTEKEEYKQIAKELAQNIIELFDNDFEVKEKTEEAFILNHYANYHYIIKEITLSYKILQENEGLKFDDVLSRLDYWNKFKIAVNSFLKTKEKIFYSEFIDYYLAIDFEERDLETKKYTEKALKIVRDSILNNNTYFIEVKYSLFLEIPDFKINENNIDIFLKYFMKYDIDKIIEIEKQCLKETGSGSRVKAEMLKAFK
jgi:hypothetical protein